MAVFDREHYFRDLLAGQVGGRIEVTLPFGRADVMTDTMVWEVEPASRYPAGVRQALQYGVQAGLPAAIATYGPRELAVKVYKHLAKLPAPGVELWWLHERRFVPIKSLEEAEAAAKSTPGRYRWPGAPPVLASTLPCEVTWQDGEVTHSCDSEPVVWEPVRLCREHRLRLFPEGPPIPGPVDSSDCQDSTRDSWMPARDLKMADDLCLTLERIAWAHMEPDSRALLAAYLIEVRSLIANAALDHPGGAKLLGWGGLDDEEDED